jgi:hypothetical protein
MGKTRIFVTTTKAKADQTAGFWKTLPDNYTVVGMGPTATIEVASADDGSVLWQSGGAAPWYGVLVTKPDVAAGGGAGAGGAGGGAGGGGG